MNKITGSAFAGTALISLLSLIVVFHLLVLMGVIPYSIVWGGRIENDSQYLLLESVSIVVNLFLLGVVLIKTDKVKVGVNPKIISVLLWMMFGLFLLNTLGNLFSKNELEKIIFTPLTLLLSIFSILLAIDRKK